ncbi:MULTISPECIES: sigma-70 family RNA polymerase sigma factor [Bacillaceae]|uniref:DNA-directed RNA polymerase n=1 Tax=Peribacillus huizhouensis TaxID=1501239 RepID=A0ABR6CTW4_9BACI|nr:MULTISPECIES: sigma-70 family RNA polymerase sigma factor [Bacillaceae]MBA9028477.1 DNA-directed RNA polymerase [Peribacillus huizhouensis]
MEKFTEMAEQFRPMIYSIIQSLSIYKNKEEFYQIGLIALWEAQSKFDPDHGALFSTYAYKVIKGKLLNALRKNVRIDDTCKVTDISEMAEDPALSSCDLLLESEYLSCYCENLTVSQKRWVIGTFQYQLSISEMAELYGVSNSAVKSWRKSAIKKLQNNLVKLNT